MSSSTVDTETIPFETQLQKTFDEMVRNQRICNKYECANRDTKQKRYDEFKSMFDKCKDSDVNLVRITNNLLQSMSKDNDWVSKEYKHDLYSSFYTDLRKAINENEKNILDQLSPHINSYFYSVIDDTECEVDSKLPDVSTQIDIISKTLQGVSDDFRSKFLLFLSMISDDFYLKENGPSLSVKVKYCKYWLGRIFEAATYFEDRHLLPFTAKIYFIYNKINLTLNVLISNVSKNKHDDRLVICENTKGLWLLRSGYFYEYKVYSTNTNLYVKDEDSLSEIISTIKKIRDMVNQVKL